jgi:hypothetical protein
MMGFRDSVTRPEVRRLPLIGLAAALVATVSAAPVLRAGEATLNPAPTAKDWANLALLPDWSGVWTPNISDQQARIKGDPVPWNPKAAVQIDRLVAAEKAGDPKGLFVDCLPESMPSWMLITHNAMEILYSPGRVTMLGESDGNRLRRIYTDGRPHPADPDPTFHGHSIGHWEGAVLIVDTVGILPETYIAVSEAVGIPNNGDMHIVEHIHLVGPDTLRDDIEVSAPHVLTGPWKTMRFFFRQRARKYDIVEGECLQGNFSEGVDASGNAIFIPAPQTEGGNLVPPAN